jgi:predicted nuclease with TOPRIM domain
MSRDKQSREEFEASLNEYQEKIDEVEKENKALVEGNIMLFNRKSASFKRSDHFNRIFF